jgi:hypothetical protein
MERTSAGQSSRIRSCSNRRRYDSTLDCEENEDHGNNGSHHVLVGYMSAGTLHVVTDTLINEVPADSSRLSFIVDLRRI